LTEDGAVTPQFIDEASMVDAWRNGVKTIQVSESREILNLVIRVRDPREEIPAELQEQRETILRRVHELLGTEAPEDLPFTHGQRIYSWGSDIPSELVDGEIALNQIEDYVVPILRQNPQSRRAMVVLGNPIVDQSEARRAESVPAPQLIQFDLEGHSLHVTAYYRAHEIYFFWVVNFIELVRLQRQVIEGLDGASAGPITTLSHNAYLNTAALDIDRRAAALPIERSQLSLMEEAELTPLIAGAVENDLESIDRLNRLMQADLDREGGRALKPQPYKAMVQQLRTLDETLSEKAASLALHIEYLASRGGTLAREEQTRQFIKARSLVQQFVDALARRPSRLPLVLVVEGMKSEGKWPHELGSTLQDEYPEAKFIGDHINVGFLDLMPFRLRGQVRHFQRYYDLAVETHKPYNPSISVVAHSYGSLVVAQAALRFNLKFDKIVLVGSVVPRTFRWSRLKFNRLLNEASGHDWVCRLARFRPGMGDSGLRGFVERLQGEDGRERVNDVLYPDREHSDALRKGHMETSWVPFLRDGEIILGPGAKLIDRPAP